MYSVADSMSGNIITSLPRTLALPSSPSGRYIDHWSGVIDATTVAGQLYRSAKNRYTCLRFSGCFSLFFSGGLDAALVGPPPVFPGDCSPCPWLVPCSQDRA